MAKTIKCNQCGAADLTKIGEHEYTCKYCHSRILIERPKFDLGNLSKTFKADNYFQTQTTYTPSGELIKSSKKIGCVILIAFIIAMAGVGVAVMRLTSNNGSSSDGTDGWKISYTPQVFYASGSKGDVIWQFTEENYDWKKNRTVLTILDPMTNKELKREIVIAEHESSVNSISLWDIYNGGKIIGDTIFFTPKNGGLLGQNIYTGKTVIDNAFIEKQIGNVVAEARAYATTKGNSIDIKDAEGNQYYYFPKQNNFVKQEDFRDRKKSNIVTKTYFSLGGNHDKKHVLRLTQQMEEFEDPEYFGTISFHDFNRQKAFYNQYKKILSVDSLPIKQSFFDAEIISWNDSSFIIKFKKNLLDNTPITFAQFNLNGKEIWSVIPASLKIFTNPDKKSITSTGNFDYKVTGNSLIISITSPFKAACSISCLNGKTNWTFQRTN